MVPTGRPHPLAVPHSMSVNPGGKSTRIPSARNRGACSRMATQFWRVKSHPASSASAPPFVQGSSDWGQSRTGEHEHSGHREILDEDHGVPVSPRIPADRVFVHPATCRWIREVLHLHCRPTRHLNVPPGLIPVVRQHTASHCGNQTFSELRQRIPIRHRHVEQPDEAEPGMPVLSERIE